MLFYRRTRAKIVPIVFIVDTVNEAYPIRYMVVGAANEKRVVVANILVPAPAVVVDPNCVRNEPKVAEVDETPHAVTVVTVDPAALN